MTDYDSFLSGGFDFQTLSYPCGFPHAFQKGTAFVWWLLQNAFQTCNCSSDVLKQNRESSKFASSIDNLFIHAYSSWLMCVFYASYIHNSTAWVPIIVTHGEFLCTAENKLTTVLLSIQWIYIRSLPIWRMFCTRTHTRRRLRKTCQVHLVESSTKRNLITTTFLARSLRDKSMQIGLKVKTKGSWTPEWTGILNEIVRVYFCSSQDCVHGASNTLRRRTLQHTLKKNLQRTLNRPCTNRRLSSQKRTILWPHSNVNVQYQKRKRRHQQHTAYLHFSFPSSIIFFQRVHHR